MLAAVVSRTGFIDTLDDVLSFTPKVRRICLDHSFVLNDFVHDSRSLLSAGIKVDFNAGVVAAGEAQIESTVTGNSSAMTTNEKESALKDQSQIYLPINNAVTKVG